MHLSGTSIIVDRFIRDEPIMDTNTERFSWIYFCTHAHADHTVGLHEKWDGLLYTSEKTSTILREKFNLRKESIEVLDMNTPILIEYETNDTVNRKKMSIVVTLIDANHCPGSVMFLFEGDFGRILYTGDFRFHPRMSENPLLSAKNIDTLYLDNTYCHPMHNFGSQTDALESILNICRKYYTSTGRIVIGIDTLGKEDVLVAIAYALQTSICVSEYRHRCLLSLHFPPVFTTNPLESRLHVVNKRIVTQKYIAHLNDCNENFANGVNVGSIKRNAIGVIISGWGAGTSPSSDLISNSLREYFNNRSQFKDSDVCLKENIFHVKYSLHSSYMELVKFCKLVSPTEKVYPVSDLTSTGLRNLDQMILQNNVIQNLNVDIKYRDNIINHSNSVATRNKLSHSSHSPNVPMPNRAVQTISGKKRIPNDSYFQRNKRRRRSLGKIKSKIGSP